MTHHIRNTCRLCDDSRLSAVLDLGSTPLANAYSSDPRRADEHYPVYLVRCEGCGHVQLPVVVDPRVLFSDYSYRSGTASSFRAHLSKLAWSLKEAGHRTLVDIGSNDGTLLALCKEIGLLGIGVDPAQNLAAAASQRCCLTVPAFFNGDVARELRAILNYSPDVVTGLNVFAHADDLGAIADGVRELIGNTGTFVFEVSYLLDVLEKNDIGTLYHEHLSIHHVAPLTDFFRRHGLALVDVQRIPAQGGSIRGFVRRDPDTATIGGTERIAECIGLELDMDLAGWPARVRKERLETMALLAPYLSRPKPNHPEDSREGGRLAIYGAPARLTTYAYALGLRHQDVTCVFDDEPRKVGRFTPGLRWPIVPSSELMARNPAAILVASWNYFEAIKAKFPNYEGQWILPPRQA